MKNPAPLLLLSCSLLAASAAADDYGPTARLHSGMVAESLRFAASRDTSSPEPMRKCIAALPDAQFEAAARASLQERYSPSELEEIDAFNRSPAARQYRNYNRDDFLASQGAAPPQPTQLSAEHVAALERFQATEVGTRYFKELAQPTQDPSDPMNVAIREFVASCRAGS